MFGMAISDSWLRFRHAEFGQDAEGGFGMQERDQFAARASNGLFVDQPHARACGLLELGFDVVRAEGDVMDAAGGVFLEELGDGAFRARSARAVPGGLRRR